MPSTRQTGRSRSLPLRSHSAVSTAEIAHDASPGRPLLRMAMTIDCHSAVMSRALRPVTAPASGPVINSRQAPVA